MCLLYLLPRGSLSLSLSQAEDDRAMLAYCKSLLAFEQKGGFAMVEDADWVPSASLKVADSPSISLPVLVV